jgi:integrase
MVKDRPTVLTDAAVRKYKPTNKRRVIRDLGMKALYLVIQESGTKSWMMRFRRPDGRAGKIVLGSLDLSEHELEADPEIGQSLSLAAARALASKLLRERKRRDVIGDHKAAKHRLRIKVEEGAANTFGVSVRRFIDLHARPETRHWRATARMLGLRYAKEGTGEPEVVKGGIFARWADRQTVSITSDDIFAVVEEATESGIPGLERRIKGTSNSRGRALARALSKLFSWLTKRRRVAVNPCLGMDVPRPPKSRDRQLTDAEIVKFWQAADAERAEFSAPLKLLLLTGQRLSEVTGMRFSELSEDDLTWTIPETRTKNKKPHKVPLAPLVRELIASVARISDDFVFTTSGDSPVGLGSKVKNRLDKAMKVPPWRLHDLRHTAVTEMGELGIRPDVIELVVNHISGHRAGIAGVYNRSELLTERRDALERWAVHVDGLVSGRAAKVVPLRQKAKAQ